MEMKQLGPSAKVSSFNEHGGNDHAVCIYTENYLDLRDVNRVRDVLRTLWYIAGPW